MAATQSHDPADALAATPTALAAPAELPAPVAASAPEQVDEAAYRAIIDAVAQLMWVNEADGSVRFFNRFGTEYMGRTNAELAGRAWLAYIHDEDRTALAATRTAAIAEGRAYAFDGRFRRHDGDYRWQRFEVQPLRGTDGTILGWIGSARDVHDEHRRAAERERLVAELAAQRALFEAAYANAPVGLTIAEASGRMIQSNAEAQRILGHAPPPTLTVDDYVRYGGIHADGSPYAAGEYVTPRVLGGLTVRQELMRYRRGDGRLILLRVSGAPVRDEDGRVTHAICTFVDDTEREVAERTLAERDERLRAALDAARTGTFRWDIRTNALDWDANLDRLFGLEPGRTARSLDQFLASVHADDRQRVVDACVRCAAEGADFDEEFRVVWPDGAIRWLHDLGRTYRDADGKPAYVTGACVDITERRRQQEELRDLAETMPQLVWMADATGFVHYFNARWTEYTGLSHDALVAGSTAHGTSSGTVHADDAPGMLERWTRAIATGEPYEVLYRLRRADGAYRWFVGRALPSRDDNGRVVRWFGSCTDIDAEVAARERLARLNAVTEALAGLRDVEAIARVVHTEAIAALGASAGSLALLREDGHTCDLYGIGWSSADVAERWRRFDIALEAPMPTAVRTGQPVYLASPAACAARFPAMVDEFRRAGIGSVAVLPLEWDGRRLGGVSFIFADAHPMDADTRAFLETLARQCAQALERARLAALERRAHQAAEAAREDAQRANLAKGAFLAMMSHDLRTPINATLGYTELMAMGIRGPLTDEQRHDLERVRQSQQALLALVNEVLDYTKVEAGRVECRRDPLPLAVVVGDVVPIVEGLAADKGLVLEVPPVPDAVAIGDRDRVRQVLLNLLTNAVKFTATGGTVRLWTSVAGEGQAARVRLHVTDTGRGIAPDRLGSVFDPFVQVDRAAEPAARQGVGLGLTIARDLARAMDGEITVESAPGVGSTFTLALRRK